MSDCGTYAGYQRHIRERTVTCPECCAASSDYQRAHALRVGRVRNLRIPAGVLAALVAGRPDAVDELIKHLGPETVRELRALADRRRTT